ncbi:hypothetical protein BDN72DRAFT_916263 [Pluteus cervinus]|uniref:Uncharacterized protein n=1 Tax=Pluteus cervinus TaxID=181527 RepID=A0ACD3AMM0_9AGAR|nr:hypothetical protein BDN72DRAFT_916263 [Pluteus cervinus]
MPTFTRSHSAISNSPIELLIEIFFLASVADPRLSFKDQRNALLTITWVSRHWRNVALDCPRLWSIIHLLFSSEFYGNGNRERRLALGFAHECIRRSKAVPISLFIDPFEFGKARTTEFLKSLLTRGSNHRPTPIRELTISTPFPECYGSECHHGILWDPTTLDVEMKTRANDKLSQSRDSYQVPIFVQRSMASSNDSLQHLDLGNCKFEWKSLFQSLPHTIAHLTICRPTQKIPVFEFLRILTYCENREQGIKPSFLKHLELNNVFPANPNSHVQMPGAFWSITHYSRQESHLTNRIQLPNLSTLKLLDVCAFTLCVLLDKMDVGVSTDVIICPSMLPKHFHMEVGLVAQVFKTLYQHASISKRHSGRIIEGLEIRSGHWGMSITFKTSIQLTSSSHNPISSQTHIQMVEHPGPFLEEIIEIFRHQSLLTNLTHLSLHLEHPLNISPFILFSTIFGHPERVPKLEEVEVSGWGGLSFLGCLDWCFRLRFSFWIRVNGLDGTGLRGGPKIEVNQMGGGPSERSRYGIRHGDKTQHPIEDSGRPLVPDPKSIPQPPTRFHPSIGQEELEEIVGTTCFPSLKTIKIETIPEDAKSVYTPDVSSLPLLDELAQHLYPIFMLEKWFGDEVRGSFSEEEFDQGLCTPEWIAPSIAMASREVARRSLFYEYKAGELVGEQGNKSVDVIMSGIAMEDYIAAIQSSSGWEWWKDYWNVSSSTLDKL